MKRTDPVFDLHRFSRGNGVEEEVCVLHVVEHVADHILADIRVNDRDPGVLEDRLLALDVVNSQGIDDIHLVHGGDHVAILVEDREVG